MKSTGIIRCIDELGRIVVPKEIRRKMDLANGDPVEIYIDGNKIILEKYQSSCIFCGGNDGITEFNDKMICKACLESLKTI